MDFNLIDNIRVIEEMEAIDLMIIDLLTTIGDLIRLREEVQDDLLPEDMTDHLLVIALPEEKVIEVPRKEEDMGKSYLTDIRYDDYRRPNDYNSRHDYNRAPPRNYSPRDMPPRDIPPRDIREAPPRDYPPRDHAPRDMPPRDVVPRDVRDESPPRHHGGGSRRPYQSRGYQSPSGGDRNYNR